jgi:hypothetical protein
MGSFDEGHSVFGMDRMRHSTPDPMDHSVDSFLYLLRLEIFHEPFF